MDARKAKGRRIASRPGQIARLDSWTYKVRSQSGHWMYDVVYTIHGWTCSCPDHYYKRAHCKHIYGVEMFRN